MYYKEFTIEEVTRLLPEIDLEPIDIEKGAITLAFDSIEAMSAFEDESKKDYLYNNISGSDPLILSVNDLKYYNYSLSEESKNNKASQIGEVDEDLYHIGNNFYTDTIGWEFLNK